MICDTPRKFSAPSENTVAMNIIDFVIKNARLI